MTREDIIRMARDSGFLILKFDGEDEVMEGDGNCFQTDEIESFAELVAANTLSNIDPSKLMSFQEGFKVGQLAEREACAKWADLVAREIDNTNNTATYIASGIRARGEK